MSKYIIFTICHGESSESIHRQKQILKKNKSSKVKNNKGYIWGGACRSLYEITWYTVSALGAWKMPTLDPHHKARANSKSRSQSGLVLAPSIGLSQNKKQKPVGISAHAFFIRPRYSTLSEININYWNC